MQDEERLREIKDIFQKIGYGLPSTKVEKEWEEISKLVLQWHKQSRLKWLEGIIDNREFKKFIWHRCFRGNYGVEAILQELKRRARG